MYKNKEFVHQVGKKIDYHFMMCISFLGAIAKFAKSEY